MNSIWVALWFFLPAGIANMTPIFLAKIPWLKKFDAPLDFNKTINGKPIFGRNKTWRGLIGGIVTATLTLWLQVALASGHPDVAMLNSEIYTDIPILIVGPLFAIGALGGDAIESFFKRRIGKKPGQSWFPFDQLDYVIGGAIATLPFVQLSWYQYLWVVAIWVLLHLLFSFIGFKMKLKDKPI